MLHSHWLVTTVTGQQIKMQVEFKLHSQQSTNCYCLKQKLFKHYTSDQQMIIPSANSIMCHNALLIVILQCNTSILSVILMTIVIKAMATTPRFTSNATTFVDATIVATIQTTSQLFQLANASDVNNTLCKSELLEFERMRTQIPMNACIQVQLQQMAMSMTRHANPNSQNSKEGEYEFL